MRAMLLEKIGAALQPTEQDDPVPGDGEVRLRIEACAVCRTDLHVVDGDLPNPKLPLVPGHEIVGVVDRVGAGVDASRVGRRVGVPWLGHTCGSCAYCVGGRENLCDSPGFTGYTRDGGFATHVVADAAFAFDLDPDADPVALAPLLCAALIGWRSLEKAGDGRRLGIYGFGAAAHIIAQVAIWQGRGGRSSPSRAPGTAKRRVSHGSWGRPGPAARTSNPVSRSTRRSSSHRSATWCLPP
jgi:propanol-preferring alcohol dehydrogenase